MKKQKWGGLSCMNQLELRELVSVVKCNRDSEQSNRCGTMSKG